MWELFLKAETFGQLPSRLLKIANDLAAYQFDNCILFAGLTIKNALTERVEYGPQNNRQSRAKYTLAQLLDPKLRLPRAGTSETGLKALAAAFPGEVGRWKQAPNEAT